MLFDKEYDRIDTIKTRRTALKDGISLTVILTIQSMNADLSRTLASLYENKGGNPFELRAVVGRENHVAPQILTVFQKSKKNFSFTVQKNATMQETVAREIGKAAGNYILIADGADRFMAEGFVALSEFIEKTDVDAVFFDTPYQRALFSANRKKFVQYASIEAFLPERRGKGAVLKKQCFEKIAPYTGSLGFYDAFAVAPLAFCTTAAYLHTGVYKRGDRGREDTAHLPEESQRVLSLADFFGEMRPTLGEGKYAFLFRYTVKRIVRIYDALFLSDGQSLDELRNFDAALRKKNMPLYLSAGERSVFSYVEKLRNKDFAPSGFLKRAVKLYLEVRNDIS